MKMCEPLAADVDYLCHQRATSLKGLLALGVLVSHVIPPTNVFEWNVINQLAGSLGYLCVSVFFFLSGYGIATQYQQKGESYIKTFLIKRCVSIYLLNLFLIAFYSLVFFLLGNILSIGQILQSFLIGDTIVPNGWYLQVVLLFYLLWYFCTYYVKSARMQFVALSGAVVVFILIAAMFLPGFWYECSLSFLLGVYWNKQKKKIDCYVCSVAKRNRGLLAAVCFIFAMTFVFARVSLLPSFVILNAIIRSTSKTLSSVAFVLLVLIMEMQLPRISKMLDARVLRYLGERSIEIYVLQGLPLALFRSDFLFLENGWGYIFCVATTTLMLSIVMHPVIRFVMEIPRRCLRRGEENENKKRVY